MQYIRKEEQLLSLKIFYYCVLTINPYGFNGHHLKTRDHESIAHITTTAVCRFLRAREKIIARSATTVVAR